MITSALLRRTVTVTAVVVLFAGVNAAMPLLLIAAGAVDLYRLARRLRRPVALRLVAFLWLYLLGELWALIALAAVAPLPRAASREATFALQQAWAAWNFNSMRALLGLEVVVEGSDQVPPAPIILLARHASMVDTLLPARYVVREHGIRLRYILKRELLFDPVIDIGGNRLPNHFVDRGSGGSEREIAAIKALAAGLEPDQGMLIYPEGTRFSEEKRDRYLAPLAGRGGVVGEVASRLERVLPPRPGGTLALLEATGADVVVLAHRGLEGFASIRDIWSGGLVGARVDLRLWRIPRSEIPAERRARIEWLFRVWADVDAWVAEKRLVE